MPVGPILHADGIPSGLQLELLGNASVEPVNLRSGHLDLVHGFADGRLRLGLLDLDGAETIAAGNQEIPAGSTSIV